jgi:hypothetical protein
MAEVIVRYAYCPEHFDRHLVDENENHIANEQKELYARGFIYLGHLGHGWYRWRVPPHEIELPPDWERLQEARRMALMDDDVDF